MSTILYVILQPFLGEQAAQQLAINFLFGPSD